MMARAIAIAIGLFLLLSGLQTGLIVYQTGDSSCLNQATIDRVTSHTTPTSDQGAEGDSDSELRLAQEDCEMALLQWMAISMSAGLFATVGWLLIAKSRQDQFTHTAMARGARPAWFLCLTGFLLVAGLTALLELVFDGAGGKLAVATIATDAVAIVCLGTLGFYLATLLGAPSLVRESVPGAAALTR